MRNILLDTNIVLLALKSRNLAGIMGFVNPDMVPLYISCYRSGAKIYSDAEQLEWMKEHEAR